MQQKQQHSQQRDEPSAEQPQREKISEQPAYEKGQVREQMTREVAFTPAFDSQRRLDQQQSGFPNRSVKIVARAQAGEGVLVSRDVAQVGDADVALPRLVNGEAVVVQDGEPRAQEHRERQQRGPVAGERSSDVRP